jgi:hypothetical protein
MTLLLTFQMALFICCIVSPALTIKFSHFFTRYVFVLGHAAGGAVG